MWRNKLEKVPRKGAEGKYGKARLKNVAITKISAKKGRSQQNMSVLPIQLINTWYAINVPERRNEIATMGDEADILSHFTAGNDVLALRKYIRSCMTCY